MQYGIDQSDLVLDVIEAAGGGYACGTVCTWHDFARSARMKSRMVDGQIKLVPTCPNCECDVKEISFEAWIATVRQATKADPESVAIVKWGRNRCFPDHDTLMNAYRQAMEE